MTQLAVVELVALGWCNACILHQHGERCERPHSCTCSRCHPLRRGGRKGAVI